MWDYADIAAQVARHTSTACYDLRGASLVMCLCALSQMEAPGAWLNGIDELTTAERDNVEAWVAGAYADLIQTCESVTMDVDEFTQTKDENTSGDATLAGLNTVHFNNAHSENAGNVAIASEVTFTPDPGLYHVTIQVSSHSEGAGRVGLYNDYDNEIAVQGANAKAEDVRTAAGLVRVQTSRFFYVWEYASESGNMGYKIDQAGVDELYARVTWVRISD